MIMSSKKIALLYFFISCIWIYTSDMFFGRILSDFSAQQFSYFNTLKGLIFILITALLLHKLINRYYRTVKRSEEEYRAMFDQNPNPMWIYDTTTMNFLKVNQAAISKYGYSESEFLKLKATDIRPLDEVETFTTYIYNNDHVKGNVGVWTHVLKGKTKIKVEAYVYDIVYNNINAKIVLLLDVTDKINYEQQLREQQETLEETNNQLETTIKELKLNKEKIASTQKIAKIGGWRYFLEEKRFDFTPSFYEIMNVSTSQHRINSISDLEKFVCEDDLDKLNNFMFHFKNGDKEDECVLRIKYGKTWRFIKLGALLTSYSPGYNVLEGFIQDITRLELKDQLIKTTLERFEQFSIATNDAIYEWDYINDVLRWTGNFSNFISDSEVEVVDKKQWWKERMHPEDWEENYNILLKAIVNGEDTVKREYRFLTISGSYKRLYDQCIIKYGENKEVIKIVGSLHDIEEMTNVNRENKRLGEIVNKVKNLIIITNKFGNIEWVNNAFQEKTGCSWEEAIGRKPWEILIYPESSEENVNAIKNAIKNEKFFNLEVENITKQGEYCWFQIDGSPIYDDNNKCIGYISIESDITERKEKEAKIKHQNKILKEAAWINSHEVRKPLASILGLIQLMQLADNDTERQEYLSLLEICSNELDVVIKKAVNIVDVINED